MAWKMLPVNYTDAVWSGLKKYNEVQNGDGTVSFQDVTAYSNKENSFFGAKDANQMNEALNTIMSMVENGTDLYTAFQTYFDEQKGLFETTASATQQGFTDYVEGAKVEGDKAIAEIKSNGANAISTFESQGQQTLNTLESDYRTEIDNFENQQEQLFNTWFEFIKGQLGTDVAGNLLNQINLLKENKADKSEVYTQTQINEKEALLTAAIELKANLCKEFSSIVVPASGWGDTAPYTQTVMVENMIADGHPLFALNEYTKEQTKAMSLITTYETQAGKIILTAKDKKPNVDINMKVMVMY